MSDKPMADTPKVVAPRTPAIAGARGSAKHPMPGLDAPEYRVLKLSCINGRLVGPGTKFPTVRYEGVPGQHLEPLNDAARKAKAEAEKAKAVAREKAGK